MGMAEGFKVKFLDEFLAGTKSTASGVEDYHANSRAFATG